MPLFFQAEAGIRDRLVTGVQTCALPISNDEVIAKFVITLGMQGNIRTTTVKAFTEAEFTDIVAALP